VTAKTDAPTDTELWSTNGTRHKPATDSVTEALHSSLRLRWNHYGYQFSIFQNLPSFIGVPIWYNSSPSIAQRPFPLRTPPHLPLPTETTLCNDSNNGFDMLVQSRDIPGISSNYFLIVSFLLFLFSLCMKKATHLPGGGFWCRQEVPFCAVFHFKRHFVVILRCDPNDSQWLLTCFWNFGHVRSTFATNTWMSCFVYVMVDTNWSLDTWAFKCVC
jgi:hypothetical protein